MTTVTDVEQALTNARVLEEHWMSNGWESLEIEEKTFSSEVVDVYPLVEVDISVTITIKLPNKSYSVPLEDVSSLSVNDCLVIGVSDLYPDWEDRILHNLGELVYETTTLINSVKWIEVKYLGKDSNFRVIRLKADSVKGYNPV